MPELPDIELYRWCLESRAVGQRLLVARSLKPFFLKSVSPALTDFVGLRLIAVERMGKRLVFVFEGGLCWVLHLMIAGRLRWHKLETKPPLPNNKMALGWFEFESGCLQVTEASPKKRAGLMAFPSREDAASQDPGGLEPLTCSTAEFTSALREENRTLKRALTSPRKFSGIGNAYSDEILFHAGLSPVRLTSSLTDSEVERLHKSVQETLAEWCQELREEFRDRFPGPGDVTAFRPDFSVHGRFGQPCRVCGHKIQRIRYEENETNYCAKCQNEGRMLADRSLSRLLKSDWPKTIEEMEGG